ncbi:MAG: AAA family ATPase [Desulfobacterium sp.]|nr:AAA family ATPase [Desulfobacterium sp.]
MGILNIRKAQREGARMVIGLAGSSGSGKTHTALILGYGMTNFDSSKVGLLDTENKRGSLFADVLKNDKGEVQPFLIGDLVPPFSPDRYATAIKEFEAAGVEVLIIDSITHEWEGTGGCGEIADNFIAGNAARTALGWARSKKEHKKLLNTLLQCDMDIICCVRAREQTSFQNPKKPVSLGVQPIQEKNFMFEMTVSILMMNEGTQQRTLKCPGDLKPYFGRGDGYITSQDGLALRTWVGSGTKVDKVKMRYENRLLMNAEQGTVHIKGCWDKTPADIRESLGEEFKNKLFASAEGYDTLRYAAKEDEPATSISKFKDLPKRDQLNPLHATPEWKQWVADSEMFPEISKTMPPPATTEQCVAACRQLQTHVDSQNAA